MLPEDYRRDLFKALFAYIAKVEGVSPSFDPECDVAIELLKQIQHTQEQIIDKLHEEIHYYKAVVQNLTSK